MTKTTVSLRGLRALILPGRVLLVGSDTVVSRALQIYLRKEGYDATTVSDDPGRWAVELSGRASRAPAQLVIIASSIPPTRRTQLCRWLRENAQTRGTPILALLDAGDEPAPAARGGVAGMTEFPALPRRAELGSAAGEETSGAADASLSWPYRLREVLGKVEELLAEPQAAAG